MKKAEESKEYPEDIAMFEGGGNRSIRGTKSTRGRERSDDLMDDIDREL